MADPLLTYAQTALDNAQKALDEAEPADEEYIELRDALAKAQAAYDNINGQLQGYQAQLDEGKKQMYAQGLISSPNLDNDQLVVEAKAALRRLKVQLLEGQLQLDDVVLEVGERALQQHLSLVQNPHMVAHVLQLPEVVAGHQHRGAPVGHIPQQQGPHLPPHHRVQTVHRLAAHGQPESRLLLLALAHPPQGLLFRQGEHLPQLVIPVPAEEGVGPGIQPGHLPGARLGEEVPVVGYRRHAALHRGIFVYRLAVQGDFAAVGPVYAGEVPDDGGFSRAVGAYQTVDRTLGDGQAGFVQGAEAVKGLDDVLCF